MNRRSAFASLLLALSVILATPDGGEAAGVDVRMVLDTATLGDPFVFDVDPAGAVLVLTRDNVFDAGSGKPLFGAALANPAWLAFADGKLQVISGGALFVVEGGKPRKLLDVPLKSRVFASDLERTFISGITAAGKPVLFIYKEGAGHKPLVELDAPIDAMSLARGVLFFSVGSRIYTLREGGSAILLVHLPGVSHIPSIAVDDRNDLLYFSDGDNLYVLRGGDFVVVRRGVGGMLRWRNGSLYILSWRDHVLLRMDGLSDTLATAGTLVPLEDPCRAPVLSLYCEADEKRAILKSLAMVESALTTGDAAARNELDVGMAEQKKELERIRAGLEKEAATGAQAVLWGGGLEPKAIGAGVPIVTGGKGVGLVLWDGSGIRIGPDSKAVFDACGPSRECRQTLEKGLLYFEPYAPPVDGMAVSAPREYVVATEALSLRFGQARLALFASGGKTAVVVLEGRVKAATQEGEAVTVISGETLEVKRGERPGMPVPAKMERLKKWWEEIR